MTAARSMAGEEVEMAADMAVLLVTSWRGTCCGAGPRAPDDCGGARLVIDGCRGIIDKCVTGISCSAACAMGPNALTNVIDCLYKDPSASIPLCKSDADCKQSKCLVPPNAAGGKCVTGLPASPCLADADCQPHVGFGSFVPPDPACVVTPAGLGFCGNLGLEGQACNTDRQCSSGNRCVIPPGAFAGACYAGANNSATSRPPNGSRAGRCGWANGWPESRVATWRAPFAVASRAELARALRTSGAAVRAQIEACAVWIDSRTTG